MTYRGMALALLIGASCIWLGGASLTVEGFLLEEGEYKVLGSLICTLAALVAIGSMWCAFKAYQQERSEDHLRNGRLR